MQGRDGNYYGTTSYLSDGTDGGALYSITPAGRYKLLFKFNGFGGSPGAFPNDPLIQATDGNFYGTTTLGGKVVSGLCVPSYASPSCGTVFRMTPGGSVKFIYQFDKTNGAGPIGPLVQGSDGNFYGTTSYGGDANGDGVIFQLTPLGKIKVLHFFNGTDGKQPLGGLVQATDGNLYGTASAGGAKGFGTLYKITTLGVFTPLHDFDKANGATPEITLFQHTNGILYGETHDGGLGVGTFYSWVDPTNLKPFVSVLPGVGTIGTKMIGILGQGFTATTTSVSFNGAPASFTFVSSTFLSATVPSAATTGIVTVVTPSGTLPSNKTFIVLPSILSFSPTSGKVASSVVITGGGLNGASMVTFGGIKATTFTVNSSMQVTATVPKGAKTGKIGTTTPAGMAISGGTFTVLP